MYCLTAAKRVCSLYFIKTFILLFILAFPFCSQAQPVSKTFDEPGSGTYTVPTGYRAVVKIQVWGGGGGGGANTTGLKEFGGGGGGYAEVLVVLPAETYTIAVGSGGGLGITGGTSSFSSTTGSIWATGGIARVLGGGTTGGSGGTSWAPASTFTAHSGGNGARGNTQQDWAGGGGGAASPAGNGSNGTTLSPPNGGNSSNEPFPSGIGGAGGWGNVNGGNGNAPGGGGGGAINGVGGSGANGRVMVTVLQSQPLPVTFGTIEAALTADKVLTVDFVTMAETNNDHFNIELSNDGEKFEKIATIQSRRPHQLYSGATTYQFKGSVQGRMLAGALVMMGIGLLSTARRHRRLALAAAVWVALSVSLSCSRSADAIPDANHKLYLRIQQVDVDGKWAYSKVILVKTQDR